MEILLILATDIFLGFLWFSLLSDEFESELGLEKLKRPWRVLIKLSFIVFWLVYAIVLFLIAFFIIIKDTICVIFK